MKESDSIRLFKKYLITDCRTLEEFMDRYYKPDRYKGRGKEYADFLLQSYQKELEEYGICWISKHDSVTGRIVAFKWR